MSSILGGSKSESKSSSESGNLAFDQISGAASPALGFLNQGGQGLAALLGGDMSGFNAYKDGMGFDWEAEQGGNSILAKQAAIGGLNSGATLKGLSKFQTGLNNQYGQNYLSGLLGLSDIGSSAGGLLTNAGQYSKSTGTSSSNTSPGMGGFLGKAATAIATGGASGF